MSVFFPINNKDVVSQLKVHSRGLAQQFHQTYQTSGETQETVDLIRYHVKILAINEFSNILQSIDLESLRESAIADQQHYISRMLSAHGFQLSLHIVPNDFHMPVHSHLRMIHAMVVMDGELDLTQYHEGEAFRHKLQQFDCSVGLSRFMNAHEFKVTSPSSTFITIRLKQKFKFSDWLSGFSRKKPVVTS